MFRELDIVRVACAIDAGRMMDLGSRRPLMGDQGTIVYVYPPGRGSEQAYIVECVEADGSTAWLADMLQSELVRIGTLAAPT